MEAFKEVAKEVFVRYGISDIILPIEDNLSDADINICNAYRVCYEDENGEECDEHGNYLKDL